MDNDEKLARVYALLRDWERSEPPGMLAAFGLRKAPGEPEPLDCTCGDTFNPKCPEHGGNEHRP